MARKRDAREGLELFFIPRGDATDLERDLTNWESEQIFEQIEQGDDDPLNVTFSRAFTTRRSIDRPFRDTLRHMAHQALDNPVRLIAVLGFTLLLACVVMVVVVVL